MEPLAIVKNESQLEPFLPLLPSVIVWDPLRQNRIKIVCKCGEELSGKQWNIGQNTFSNPRILHDFDKVVFLIGRVYRCHSNHELLSYSPQISCQFPTHFQFPFHLQYRTGLVTSFIQELILFAEHGVPFTTLANIVTNRRRQYKSQAETCFWKALLWCKQNGVAIPSHEELQQSYEAWQQAKVHSIFPSRTLIISTYVENFFKFKEQYYIENMKNLKCDGSISLDHTFEVASNIGYLRSDGKWICQYSALFIVMNEVGEVVTWQFTKTKSFSEVENLLKQFNKRNIGLNGTITTIYIDDCCNWRGKLQNLLGNVDVKLDLFHAIQRVTKSLSKKHKYYHPCLKQLRLILRDRDEGDIQQIRRKTTPTPDKILKNIDDFISTWEKVEFNGILTDKCLKELRNLKSHVSKGCLSGIPVGMGTNRNEALHKYINPFFTQSRMSVHMAYALLTLLFFCHNAKTRENQNAYSLSASQAKKEFFCYNAHGHNTCPHTITNRIALCKAIDQDHCYSMNEIIGIVPTADEVGKHWGVTRLPIDYEICESLDNDAINATVGHFLSGTTIKEILFNASKMATVTESLTKIIDSPLFNYQTVPFMSKATELFSCFDEDADGEACQHQSRLDGIINGMKGVREPVSGDGNCCFSAVAFSVKDLCERMKDLSLSHHFSSLLTHEFTLLPIHEAALLLRKKALKEWTDNTDFYQQFLTTTTVATEVEKFCQSGFFQSELGNCTITALANVLEVSIVVITSIPNMPFIRVDPRKLSVSYPIFVAFNQHGPGHYDGISFQSTPKPHLTNHCRCGINDKS